METLLKAYKSIAPAVSPFIWTASINLISGIYPAVSRRGYMTSPAYRYGLERIRFGFRV